MTDSGPSTPPTRATQPTRATPPPRATPATQPTRPRMSTRRLVVLGVLVSLFLAGVVSFYASRHPDGLVFVAGEKGFLGSARPHATDGSPFAGYSTRGVANARLSGGIAGVVGATLVFVLAGGLFLVVRRRNGSDTTTETSRVTSRAPSSDGQG